MKKRNQLNIDIESELLKSLKILAISKNLPLNALVRQIISENVTQNISEDVNLNIMNELKLIKERLSNLEKLN
mgnify:CR=1 FL=1